jgi:hypothetical protein
MATVAYSKSSAYSSTSSYGPFLDLLSPRTINKYASDKVYTVDRVYHNRPDLLAHDLYGNAGLWWVFAARNPNALKDPLFDFATGVTIYVPLKTTLINDLGLQ